MKKIIVWCILFFSLWVSTLFALEPSLEAKIQTLVQRLSLEKSKKLQKVLEKKIAEVSQKTGEAAFLRYEIYSYILSEIQTKISLWEGWLKDIFESIFTGYVQKNTDAHPKVSVIIYDDLECPFCALLHNNKTIEKLRETYQDDIQIVFQHYPLSFHKNAATAAALLECIGEKTGTSWFYDAVDQIFTSKDPAKENVIKIWGQLGVKKEDLDAEICSKKYKQKIESQMNIGVNIFKIQGTPSSVIVDNTTYKYEVISWAVPYDSFKKTIDTFLPTKKESK